LAPPQVAGATCPSGQPRRVASCLRGTRGSRRRRWRCG
jgi:hypothetical protein